jgi:hypothetical protein
MRRYDVAKQEERARVEEVVRAHGWYPELCSSGGRRNDGGWDETWTLSAFLLADPEDVPKDEYDAERLPDIALQRFKVEAHGSYSRPADYENRAAWDDPERKAAMLAEMITTERAMSRELANEIIARFEETVRGGEVAMKQRRNEELLRNIEREIAQQERLLENLRARRDSYR